MIVHSFDTWHVFGNDGKCLTFPVVGNGTLKFDDAVADRDVDFGCPRLLVTFGQDLLPDSVIRSDRRLSPRPALRTRA